MKTRDTGRKRARIGLLADHPDVLLPLAAAFEREWPKWYGVHGDAMTDLRERSRRSGFPVGFVALEGESPVGAVAIAESPVPGHNRPVPSVVGFWVEPSRRRRGIGAQLLAAACVHARRQGITRLHAATIAAAAVFVRDGWTMLDVDDEPGVKTNIFWKTPEAS